MNCFEWRNRSSDHLDGTLIGALKRESDEHLESCSDCTTKQAHYRQILASINSQPRISLPVTIRKSPLAFALPKTAPGQTGIWRRAPWPLRVGTEGLGAIAIIIALILVVPRIRILYEQSIERRLDIFSLTEPLNDEAASAEAPRLQRARKTLVAGESEITDDFQGENSDGDTAEAGTDSEAPLRVGNGEIWRFNLKSDSPRQMQPKITALLTSLNVPKDTTGIGGIEAPGGIQFDLLVSRETVAPLKVQLKRLTTATGDLAADRREAPLAPFTWYKNRSRRTIPSGKARVVIWLSQT